MTRHDQKLLLSLVILRFGEPLKYFLETVHVIKAAHDSIGLAQLRPYRLIYSTGIFSQIN